VFNRLSKVEQRNGKLRTVNAVTGLVEEAEFLETSSKIEALQFVNAHAKEKTSEDKGTEGKTAREN
jgi:predicted RecB family endonuclease